MKRKILNRHFLITAVLMLTIGLNATVWGNELSAIDESSQDTSVQATTLTDNKSNSEEKTKKEDTEKKEIPKLDLKNAPSTVVPQIEISQEEGVYQSYETIFVMLTAPEGYSIYYTLDGSDATAESTPFTQAFAVKAPDAMGGKVTLHAIAIKHSNN